MIRERRTALALTILSACFHVQTLWNAGGLWRDEADCLAAAASPTLSALWHAMARGSFPLLFYRVLRLWNGLAPAGDRWLRGLGLAIGLCVLAALWRSCLVMGRRAPLLALALIGLSP